MHLLSDDFCSFQETRQWQTMAFAFVIADEVDGIEIPHLHKAEHDQHGLRNEYPDKEIRQQSKL